MSIIAILIPLALLLGFAFVCLFLWAVKADQFSDGETPAVRMLIDDSDPQNGGPHGQP